MNELIKAAFKIGFTGIIWTFILSITWQGRPIFYHANDILVQNEIVSSMDESLAEIWERVNVAAKSAWNGKVKDKESVSF